MELRVLKYFLTIAEEENITRAAKLLHITQPTLSRQIQQLEDELGVTLFQRGSHRISLTEDGLLLKHRAQEIIDLTEKTFSDFSTAENNLAGKITVGCAETYNMKTLAELMAKFRAKFPLVTFQIVSGTADLVTERIEAGLVDVGLLMEPVDVARYDVLRMPLKERWGAMFKAESPLAQKNFICPRDLLEVPLILPERPLVQSALKKWLGNKKFYVAATYTLLLNAVFMVEKDLGAALCYDFSRFFPSLKFVPLCEMPDSGAVLVWKKQKVFSKAARKFIELCQTEMLAGYQPKLI